MAHGRCQQQHKETPDQILFFLDIKPCFPNSKDSKRSPKKLRKQHCSSKACRQAKMTPPEEVTHVRSLFKTTQQGLQEIKGRKTPYQNESIRARYNLEEKSKQSNAHRVTWLEPCAQMQACEWLCIDHLPLTRKSCRNMLGTLWRTSLSHLPWQA